MSNYPTWTERKVFPAKGNVDELQSARCSACGKYHTTPYSYYFDEYNYCPNCGMEMVKADKEKEE